MVESRVSVSLLGPKSERTRNVWPEEVMCKTLISQVGTERKPALCGSVKVTGAHLGKTPGTLQTLSECGLPPTPIQTQYAEHRLRKQENLAWNPTPLPTEPIPAYV